MTSRVYRSLVRLAERALPTGTVENLRRSVRRIRSERAARDLTRRLEWWDAQPADGSCTTVRLQKGVRMNLYFGGELSRLVFSGGFEGEERTFLNAFLRRGDCFVDIGANLGLFSLIAAKVVGRNGSVHAFEPAATTCERLRQNVALNHFTNIHVHQLALSSESGERTMATITDGRDAWNSFAKPHVNGTVCEELVATRTWDEFAAEHHLDGAVALMKIDVEGWELPVLQGARRFLSHPGAPVLQVEFTDEAASAAGFSCQAVYRLLEEYGYRMYRFEAMELTIHHDPIRTEYPYLNLFAIKNPDSAQGRLHGGRSLSLQ